MLNSCLLDPRWRQRVFTVTGRDYDWLDIFLSAMQRGDWAAFERPFLQGLACAAEAYETTNAWPAESRIDEAATAFRYDRDLLTTDETMAWLERAGLGIEDWTDFLARKLLREKWQARLDELMASRGQDLSVSASTLAAEGLGSDTFRRFAQTLAGHAAVVASLGESPLPHDPGEAFRVAKLVSAHVNWLGGLDSTELAVRMEHVTRLEKRFTAHVTAAKTEQALAQQLARHRLEWTRVDLERISFGAADAAREAAFCVREDGLTLSDVAVESRQTVRDERALLERIEPELRDAVLSANTDDLIGPVEVGGRFELALLVGKQPADLADPLVRARAEEAVIEHLMSKCILAQVHWVERLKV